MKPRYSHALTIAYEVDSNDPVMPSLDEALAGLKARVAALEADPDEAYEALLSERPFDTVDRLEDIADDLASGLIDAKEAQEKGL